MDQNGVAKRATDITKKFYKVVFKGEEGEYISACQILLPPSHWIRYRIGIWTRTHMFLREMNMHIFVFNHRETARVFAKELNEGYKKMNKPFKVMKIEVKTEVKFDEAILEYMYQTAKISIIPNHVQMFKAVKLIKQI